MAAATASILPLACLVGTVVAVMRPFGDGFVDVITVLAGAGVALVCAGLMWARRT